MEPGQSIFPPPSDAATADPTHADACQLVGALRQAGLCGPLYIIASDDSVGRCAPAWAAAFAQAGWIHRVRVIAGQAHAAAEEEQLAAEARLFRAGVIIAVGAAHEHAVGRGVAGATGLPLALWPDEVVVVSTVFRTVQSPAD